MKNQVKEITEFQKYEKKLDYILMKLRSEILCYYKDTNLNLKVWAFVDKEKINIYIDELNNLIQNNKET